MIRGARQLLTLRGSEAPRRGAALGKLDIIVDGAVLISKGRIVEVGSSRRVEALAAAREADEISAAGRVVAPGFVDSHTHLVAGQVRAFEDADRRETPEFYWRPLQQISQRMLETQGLRVLEDFVRHGTTTLEAKSGFGVKEATELKILRTQTALKRRTSMVASTFMPTHWGPTEFPADVYIDRVCSRMLPLIRKRGLAEFADIACEKNAFTFTEARQFLSVAKQLGLTPKLHAGRTSRTGAVSEAVRLGAASIDHLVVVDDEDVRALAGGDTVATLLPGRVFFSGEERYAPARRLIDEGAAVALATGYNPQTSPSRSMLMTIALACRKMGMTAAEAIAASTINGAHAMRRAGETGSLEEDKSADIVIFGVPDYRELPCHFGVNLVDTTIKNGRVLFERSAVRWPRLLSPDAWQRIAGLD